MGWWNQLKGKEDPRFTKSTKLDMVTDAPIKLQVYLVLNMKLTASNTSLQRLNDKSCKMIAKRLDTNVLHGTIQVTQQLKGQTAGD